MIAICPNPFRDIELKQTLFIQRELKKRGKKSVICPVFAEGASKALPAGITYYRLAEVVQDLHEIIVLGGDGTILAAAREIFDFHIPIVGVNMGNKGFMASLEVDDVADQEAVFGMSYVESPRMNLEVELIRSGEVIYRDRALNDVVARGYSDCIDILVHCDRDKLTSFSGDGIIISTPTGSTGYSMSAGGPIVEPEASAMIVSSICAHTMSSRSYVLSSGHEITITPGKLHERKAYMSVDGQTPINIYKGDIISVRRSDSMTYFADFKLKSFYEKAHDKLR